jgi:hypothetical protein
MVNILRLYDVSNYIHAGVRGDKNKGKRYRSKVVRRVDGSFGQIAIPVAGVSFTLNAIFEAISYANSKPDVNVTMAFCLDKDAYFKWDMYSSIFPNGEGYKSNRGKSSDLFITSNKSLVLKVLESVSHNVFYGNGYEADDYIYSLANRYAVDFDRVEVYTLDHDMYCLCRDNISIGRVTTRDKAFNKDTFDQVMDIPFNTTVLEKLRTGDASDCIPALPSHMMSVYEARLYPEIYQYMWNLPWMRGTLEETFGKGSHPVQLFDLLTPMTVPNELIELSDEKLNIKNLYSAGKLSENKYLRSVSITPELEMIDIFDKAAEDYYYKGGE